MKMEGPNLIENSNNCNSTSKDMEQFFRKCKELVEETRYDLEIYQKEQSVLKAKILSLMEENRHLESKLCQEFKEDGNKHNHDVISNVHKQIMGYKNENDELRMVQQMAERTIDSLNKEIYSLRKQLFQTNSLFEIKEKYKKVIKILQNAIEKQKIISENQEGDIKKLKKENGEILKQCDTLRVVIEKRDIEINDLNQKSSEIKILQEKLYKSLRENESLKSSIRNLESSLLKSTERENAALQKVHYAVFIAEAAVSEKEAADHLVRHSSEQVLSLQDEYSSLAANVSIIMEEAAAKVDRDIEVLKRDFAAREEEMIETQNKLNAEILKLQKENEDLQKNYDLTRLAVKETLIENKSLIKELQITQQQLMKFEDKLLARKCKIEDDDLWSSKERDQELKNYVKTNREIIEKYKVTIKEMTKNFEKEMARMRSENEKLKILLKSEKR